MRTSSGFRLVGVAHAPNKQYCSSRRTTFMKKLVQSIAVALALLIPAGVIQAGDPKEELQTLVEKINAKLKAGKNAEKDFADNLAEFDKLLAAHKDEKTEGVARIALMKAMLYLQVLEDEAKALPLLTQLKKDFPNTKPALAAEEVLKRAERVAAVKEMESKLVVGAKFPDFAEKDLSGKPLSVANFKGKIVLVDFWATWCGPCMNELPNVIKAYEKYHSKGFEVIGISLDEFSEVTKAKDQEKLTKFLASKKMTWPQFCDGLGW
ncbi:MAG: TlpA family protein disulfide reductase, partial [Proteobacteria bacterium]|nr:TlpA family protein disulfide reductase [Pseudomonadota bacterium]